MNYLSFLPLLINISIFGFTCVFKACKESCPESKRFVCGMRAKTFKNKCMITCLNRGRKKAAKIEILVAHKGKCVSGRGNLTKSIFFNY